ncbi:MAG: ParM/StbA family protein [Rhizonema sp. NSF051]|nr:ParM/StbA family protein [Rhizonema sp. NSF051]
MDLGGSQTKVIASVPESSDSPILLCMEPEIADVSAASVRNYEKTKSGEVDPENACWVGIGDEYYTVGFLARHKYGGNSLLKQLKEENAVPKIGGVLWVLQQKLKLSPKLIVRLTVLLPPSEYQDRERLEAKLRQELKLFNTPTGEMRVKLVDFNAKPEGGGIYLYRRSMLGANIKNRNMAVVMLGHRNASVLVSVRGAVAPGVSSTFGMSWMLDDFVRRCSGLLKEDPQLMAIIVAAGSECNSSALASLSRRNSSAEESGEATEMQEALKLSRDEYFRALVRWLSQELPRDLDEIIFGGGTAAYLKPELEAHYSHVSITWNGGVEIPPGLDTAGMSVRIADVWALYQVCFGMDKSIKKDDSAEQQHPTPVRSSPDGKSAGQNLLSGELSGVLHPADFAAVASSATERNVVKPKGFLEMPEKL